MPEGAKARRVSRYAKKCFASKDDALNYAFEVRGLVRSRFCYFQRYDGKHCVRRPLVFGVPEKKQEVFVPEEVE